MSTSYDKGARTPDGTRANPTVWADGYGVWHASVPITTPARQAYAARILIMAELLERAPRGHTAREIRLSVTRAWATNHGTVVYKER